MIDLLLTLIVEHNNKKPSHCLDPPFLLTIDITTNFPYHYLNAEIYKIFQLLQTFVENEFCRGGQYIKYTSRSLSLTKLKKNFFRMIELFRKKKSFFRINVDEGKWYGYTLRKLRKQFTFSI